MCDLLSIRLPIPLHLQRKASIPLMTILSTSFLLSFQIIPNGIVRKTKLAEVNVYCPSSPLDYRITISQELPSKSGVVGYE